MRMLIPLLAGSGLALCVSGFPPLRKDRLARRIDPFLNGLDGRPSALLPRRYDGRRARRRALIFLAEIAPSAGAGTRERLLAAGQSQTPDAFRLEQIVWAIRAACVVLASAVVGRVVVARPDVSAIPVLVVLAAVTGWVLRDRRLSVAVGRRRARVREQLPLALDLLTLSIMAGEALPQAVTRVAGLLDGDVGAALDQVVASMRSGAPLVEAIEELSQRLPDRSVARLVDALCTAIERGAPLADTLRTQAEDLREARSRELMETGGRREILMLLPVVFLILPTVVAFALLPGLASLELLVP